LVLRRSHRAANNRPTLMPLNSTVAVYLPPPVILDIAKITASDICSLANHRPPAQLMWEKSFHAHLGGMTLA